MIRAPKLLAAVTAAALAATPGAARASDFFQCLKAAGPDELKAAGDATLAVAALVDDPACTALTTNPVYIGLAAAIAATSVAANVSGNAQLSSVFGDSQRCIAAPENAALTIANVLLPLIPGLKNNADLMAAIQQGDSAAASQFLQPALEPLLAPYDCACKFADLVADAKKLLNDGLQTVNDAEACGRLLGNIAEDVGEGVQHGLHPGCCEAPGTTGAGGTQVFYSCQADQCDPKLGGQLHVSCDCPAPRVWSGGYCVCQPGSVFTGQHKTPGAGSCTSWQGPSADFRPLTYPGGSCQRCPANTLADTRSNECVPLDCPAGKRPGKALGSCVNICPVSKAFDKASGKCVTCDAKSVPNLASGVGCQACPAGQVVGTPRSGVDFENLKPQCVTLKACPAGMIHQLNYATRCLPCDEGFAPDGPFTCKPTAAGLAKAQWLSKCLKQGMTADEASSTQGCKKCLGRSKAWAGSGFPGECYSQATPPPPPPHGTGPQKQPLKQ